MKKILLYVQLQFLVFIVLQLITVVPLIFLFKYYPNEFPDVEYFFFTLLVIIKIIASHLVYVSPMHG